MVMLAVIGVLAVCSYRLWKNSMKAAKCKEELELCLVRNELEQKYYRSLEEQHEKYDIMFHDMKHVMRTIAVLADDNNIEEIKKLTESFHRSAAMMTEIEYCSNKVLNALFMERMCFAKQEKVTLRLEIIEPLHFSRFEELDLIALIGNLLDNAIIAESKAKNPKGIMCRIALAQNRKHILIQVENSYEEKTVSLQIKPEGEIGRKHGIGLKSVEGIVNKYNGIIDCSKENGRYGTKIILPI